MNLHRKGCFFFSPCLARKLLYLLVMNQRGIKMNNFKSAKTFDFLGLMGFETAKSHFWSLKNKVLFSVDLYIKLYVINFKIIKIYIFNKYIKKLLNI